MLISAVIIVKNEEQDLPEALESVSFCDETVVIDNGSSDKTRLIAEQYKAHVVRLEGIHDFSQLRNRGLNEAKSDWILFIDADERVSPALRDEILNTINSSSKAG